MEMDTIYSRLEKGSILILSLWFQLLFFEIGRAHV